MKSIYIENKQLGINTTIIRECFDITKLKFWKKQLQITNDALSIKVKNNSVEFKERSCLKYNRLLILEIENSLNKISLHKRIIHYLINFR